MGLLQNFASQLINSEADNTLHVEYDDELPDGQTDEVVLLSNEAEPKELGKELMVGTRKNP